MKKTISTDMTAANIALVLGLLAATPGGLEEMAGRLPPGQERQPLGPGERSPNEAIGHILNGESRTVDSITQALLLKEPLIASIHPERQLGRLLRLDLLAFPELLTYFKLRRRVLLRMLFELKEAQWARTVREEGKQRQESVYWLARAQALHELAHLQDLNSKVGQIAGDRSSP